MTHAPTLDVRSMAPSERHPLIFQTFDTLEPGQWLELVNDHDPLPLRKQFEAMREGGYGWTYLEQGPSLWRVQIKRLVEEAVTAKSGNCCSGGSCG